MNFVDNIKGNFVDAFEKVGTKAKEKIDVTKLEIKIKSYNKDIEALMIEIGSLTYKSVKNKSDMSTEKISELCSVIDNRKQKVRDTENQIKQIKFTNTQKKNTEEYKDINIDDSDYSKLNKKEDDFKLQRTEEGIQILKFCPSCHAGNKQSEACCINCGHSFMP